MVVAPLGICWAAALAFAALDGRRKRIGWAASIVLAIAWLVSIWLTWDVVQHGPRTMVAGDWTPGIGIVLRLDALGALFATLSLGVLLAIVYRVYLSHRTVDIDELGDVETRQVEQEERTELQDEPELPADLESVEVQT
jgi:formate hydrogenlyase subunit 3/multisubunit Na+/H+ antiporter MnhD subunit